MTTTRLLLSVILLLGVTVTGVGFYVVGRLSQRERRRLGHAVVRQGHFLGLLGMVLVLPWIAINATGMGGLASAIMVSGAIFWGTVLAHLLVDPMTVVGSEWQLVPAVRVPDTAPKAPDEADVDTPVAIVDEVDGGEAVAATSVIWRAFRWTFTPRDGTPREQAFKIGLDPTRYAAQRAEARRPAGTWAHYALAETPEIDKLAVIFYQLHEGRGWSTLEQAANVLCFTQSCIEYDSDEATTPGVEWPRYPLETLVDGVGDCEDDVILASAVLKRLGFDVALLYYPGHCALGVAGAAGLPGAYVLDSRTQLRYFYGETTATGWHIGDVPPRYRGVAPDRVEVVHRPIG